MARTFNAGIWGDIGDAVARDDILRRERNQKALGGLLDAAKFIEKTNANRKLRKDWQDYFANRKAAQDAAAEDAAAQDMADAFGVEDSLAMEGLPAVASIFGDDVQAPDEMESSIWGGPLSTDDPVNNVVRFGFDPVTAAADAEFMQAFDPSTATDDEIRRAQAIVGTGVDGKWGKKSRAAYNKYKGV